MAHAVTVIPGDGIGPEVISAAREIVDASGARIDWHEANAGAECLAASGEALPEATLESIRSTGVALKGPTATPSGSGFRSVNVALRQQLDLFANYRPAKSMAGISSRYQQVDLIVIRENTEGLYSGLEHTVVPGVVESLRVITERACQRIVRFAFETAVRENRQQVTFIHKANILKLSDGLFLSTAQRVADDYPDIEFNDCIVDAAAMRLVLDPHQFDVLVMENLFGDILSDLSSGLVGGLGVTPSANLGEEMGVFEAVHGSAPDIAGRGLANPSAVTLSAALMLRHLGEPTPAARIEQAVRDVIEARQMVTGDLGGSATTAQFTQAIIAQL